MTATCPTCRKLVTFTPRFAAWCCPLCTSLFTAMTPEQQAWILGDEEADRRVRWAMLCQTGQAVLIGLIVAVALWWTR